MAETITVHSEPIDVDTPFGKALCIAWYDYGFWTETQWKCVTLNGGKIVFVPHQDIRLVNHYSARINSSKPPTAPSYMAKVSASHGEQWGEAELKASRGEPEEGVTSVDKFSDADHGKRWARHSPTGSWRNPYEGDEPMHLPEEDGA